MSVRAVLLLGLCLVAAALVQGGIYSAGQDFVLNRFTGRFQFVPAEDEEEDTTPTRRASAARCLDAGRERGLGSQKFASSSAGARR